MTFKTGDIITPSHEIAYFTMGRPYTVLSVDEDNEQIELIDDDEDRNEGWDASDFKLISAIVSLQNVESFMHKALKVKGLKTSFTPDAFTVWNKHHGSTDKDVVNEIRDHGYCLTLENKDGFILASKVEFLNNIMSISDDYNAIILEETVEVGCQSIPIQTVRDILDRWNALYDA